MLATLITSPRVPYTRPMPCEQPICDSYPRASATLSPQQIMGLVSFGTVANFDSNSPSLCVPLLSIGRQGAFDQNQIGSENEFPATTVSGTQSGDITLYYLAARSAGQAFENPRRISAYRYPEQYGPASPAFSHSMLKRWCDVTHLYISGTASIVVHASRHQLPNEQLDDIVCNLRALVIHASAESGIDFCLEPHVPLKVYVRDIHDVPALRAPLQATLPTAPTLFFVSDICRRALGIEIEAFILSSPHV